MNHEDINALLESSKKQKVELDKKISKREVDKVLLKNLLENYRSVLDYLAIDIGNSIQNKSTKIYFPYGQKENHFKKSIKRNLPNLKLKSIRLYDIIEQRQPFKSRDSWLTQLCELTNEAKHNNLTKTEKDQKEGLQIGRKVLRIKDLSKIKGLTFLNNYLGGEKLSDMKIDNGKVTKLSGGFEKIIFTNYEIIKFHGRDIEISPYLEKVHNEIFRLKNEIYYHLDTGKVEFL